MQLPLPIKYCVRNEADDLQEQEFTSVVRNYKQAEGWEPWSRTAKVESSREGVKICGRLFPVRLGPIIRRSV